MNTNRIYKGIQLDPRLKKCAEFVRYGARVADVGTDHGYLPIFLLQTGKVNFARLLSAKAESPIVKRSSFVVTSCRPIHR